MWIHLSCGTHIPLENQKLRPQRKAWLSPVEYQAFQATLQAKRRTNSLKGKKRRFPWAIGIQQSARFQSNQENNKNIQKIN